MRNCNCEHWQICQTCEPDRFDADGKLKPPEPTPLQACRAQVKALTVALFQAQEAAKELAKQPVQQPLTDEQIGAIGRACEKFDKNGNEWFDRWEFARAIERAHRIGGEA